MRDPWSRDLTAAEIVRKHWTQQYDHNRRFLLLGGFGKGTYIHERKEVHV